MALKTKLQQLFNRPLKKQNEYLLAQENAMSEYQQYKTKFGTVIAEAELSYAVSNELFENWRANYKDVNTNRFDAAWRYIDNKDFIDSLKTNDLPSWVRKKDPILDGIFVPDDAHFVDIVSLNYDELEEYRPDLHHGYKMLGEDIACIVMYNQQAEKKLSEEQIGEEIFKEDIKRNSPLLISERAQMSFKNLPKYKQLDYLKKYYLGESVAEKLQEQDKVQKRDHAQFGDLVF